MKISFKSVLIMLGMVSSSAIAQTVGEFTGIKVSDPIDIVLTQSDSNTIRTEPAGSMDQLKTKAEGGMLEISFIEKPKSDNTVTVFIGMKKLERLEVGGAADVKSDNQLMSDVLHIESSGAGNINLDVKANEVKARISGAGDVRLKGSTTALEATITGAGELKAFKLESKTAKIKASGAGNAKINVNQALDAEVSGAGSVIYIGNPADRNVNISGAGSVRQTADSSEKEKKEDNRISVDISLDTDDFEIEEDTLDPEDPDTTRINLKKMKVLIIEKDKNDYQGSNKVHRKKDDDERNRHWAGLYLGANGFLTPKYSLNMPAKASFLDLNYAKSIHFAFNFLEKDIKLHKEYVMLVTGLGFDFNSYALKNNISLQKNELSIYGVKDTINKFTKNKLKTTFINVPLMLAFNTHSDPDKAFHFAAGMIFGYALSTKTKQRYDFKGDEINAKIKDDYFINPFRTSATVQIGYGNLNLYASYALNSLFKGARGPELYPFTVGLRLLSL